MAKIRVTSGKSSTLVVCSWALMGFGGEEYGYFYRIETPVFTYSPTRLKGGFLCD